MDKNAWGQTPMDKNAWGQTPMDKNAWDRPQRIKTHGDRLQRIMDVDPKETDSAQVLTAYMCLRCDHTRITKKGETQ